HIQEYKTLAQRILRPSPAENSAGSAHDSDGLASPGAIPIRARSPVNGVLQDARDAVVILRRDEKNGIGCTDMSFEFHDHGWRIRFLVLVKCRDLVKAVERFQNCVVRNQGLGSLQYPPVERLFAQAS